MAQLKYEILIWYFNRQNMNSRLNQSQYLISSSIKELRQQIIERFPYTARLSVSSFQAALDYDLDGVVSQRDIAKIIDKPIGSEEVREQVCFKFLSRYCDSEGAVSRARVSQFVKQVNEHAYGAQQIVDWIFKDEPRDSIKLQRLASKLMGRLK